MALLSSNSHFSQAHAVCFKFLNTRELCVSLGVCQSWLQQISSTSWLFREIKIQQPNVNLDDAAVARLIAMAKGQAREFALDGAHVTGVGLQGLRQQPNLQSFALTNSDLISVDDLTNFLPPSCTELVLEGSGYDEADIRALVLHRKQLSQSPFKMDIFICESCDDATSIRTKCAHHECDSYKDTCEECVADTMEMEGSCQCTNCKAVACVPCASWSCSHSDNGFGFCSNDKCNTLLCFGCTCWDNGPGMTYCETCHKSLCFDCSCWGNGCEGMTYCTKCNKSLCFDCSCWKNGSEGMNYCAECHEALCFDCATSWKDGPGFTYCSKCMKSLCSKCATGAIIFNFDPEGGFEPVCHDCSGMGSELEMGDVETEEEETEEKEEKEEKDSRPKRKLQKLPPQRRRSARIQKKNMST